MIALVVHPLFVEAVMTAIKFGEGLHIIHKIQSHPFYIHIMLFSFEATLNLFRRFLFNDTSDVNITLLLVILSGFQEVLIRSCMEWKEVNLRKLLGQPALSPNDMVMKRRLYSYSVTSRSILELVCIILAPIMYVFFFNNKYAIDLGYAGVDQLNYESIFSSTILQMMVELLVILACSLIEFKNGIPLSG